MGSKFFGNRTEKQTPGKKGGKQNFNNKNNKLIFKKHNT